VLLHVQLLVLLLLLLLLLRKEKLLQLQLLVEMLLEYGWLLHVQLLVQLLLLLKSGRLLHRHLLRCCAVVVSEMLKHMVSRLPASICIVKTGDMSSSSVAEIITKSLSSRQV
jgi:hypothetical protein